MKKYLLLIAAIFLFCSFILNDVDNIIPVTKDDTVSLIFAGDIMGHSPQYNAAYNPKTKSYNYDICFQTVKSYIEAADFAVVNLEVPLAGAPYSGYPNFSSPDALLDGLKNAGYDVILTANNHALDRGKSGLERTIRTIKKRNLLFAGSYVDKLQRDSVYPILLEQKGLKIALLNCTYGTNWGVTTYPNIVNYLDTIQILNDIRQAEAKNADILIMTVHWGTEYEMKSNPIQKNYARFFVQNGIDLVIGSHPHVVQNAEFLIGKDSIRVPVFYSLGNSLTNQRDTNTDGGIMVKVEIGCNSKKILNTSYLPVYVYKGVLNAVYQYHLIPTTDFITHPTRFQINKADSAALIYFDKETRKQLSNIQIFQ